MRKDRKDSSKLETSPSHTGTILIDCSWVKPSFTSTPKAHMVLKRKHAETENLRKKMKRLEEKVKQNFNTEGVTEPT